MSVRLLRFALIPLLVLALGGTAVSSASALEKVGQFGVGTPGVGSDELTLPLGVAVTPSGDVVASDVGAARVVVFGPSGKFKYAFGFDVATGPGEGPEVCVANCQAGKTVEDGASLSNPWGIAASATEIYVADIGHARITAFTHAGKFLRTFGRDVGGPGVNVCTASCKAGTPSAESGGLGGPQGLSLSPAGELFVADIGIARINVFNPTTGEFLRAFGRDVGGPGVNTCTTICQVGSPNGTPGSLTESGSIAVGPGGEIAASEPAQGRVAVFNAAGQFQRTISGPGTKAGQTGSISGIATSPDRKVYLGDQANFRMAIFDWSGSFIAAIGRTVIPGSPEGIQTCTAATGCQPGAGGMGVAGFSPILGLATDCRGAVYVGVAGRIEKWAEPGTVSPPCPVPPPAEPAKPDNRVEFGKFKPNKKKGTATLIVRVPGPGELVAGASNKFAAKFAQPRGAGNVTVTIKAAGKGVKKLNKQGGLKGTLKVTFTPTGGDAFTTSRKFQLKKTIKKPAKKKSANKRAAKK